MWDLARSSIARLGRSPQAALLAVLIGLGLPCGWAVPSRAAEPPRLELPAEIRQRCVDILRTGLKSDEFWPAMHAAEALTVSGHGAEVREQLAARVALEPDDQRRCGLARELVRAGDLTATQVMLDILASQNPHGHVHACESLFKVWQLGDGQLLRQALRDEASPKKVIMAAAALSRGGNPAALTLLREFLRHPDGEVARIAAWVLARTGSAVDLPELRAGAARFSDPLTKAYFEHALAALGDPAGLAALVRNLENPDSAVRIYACEFAPDANAVAARPQLEKLLEDSTLDVRIRAAQALLQLAGPKPLDRHQVVTNDVFLATKAHPRYSEGSVAVLADGRYLFATTEFFDSESDFAAARIVGVESRDGGRSWTAPRVLQENVGRKNVMSVTLRRLSFPARFDAPLGFFYLVKNDYHDLQVHLRTSLDQGATFSEGVRVTTTDGYHVLNNDRITILASGRIVAPVASTADVTKENHFVCSCFLSDDRGRTWRRSQNVVDYAQRGAMEPEVVELADGRLLMHIRTQLGHIAVSESSDGGESWSAARPWNVRAPEAPATLRSIPATGDLLLIWNNTFTEGAGHGGKRTPLTAAVSSDAGRTWNHVRNLETSQQHTYAYTSVTFDGGRALLTYYVGDDETGRISSRFRSVPVSWFYGAPDVEQP